LTADLQTRLRKAIGEQLNLHEFNMEGFDNDTPLFGEGLGLDSLDAVEMAEVIREQFGVRISSHEEGMRAFRSINAMAAFVAEKGGR
jgi:acyl carrier protein